MHTPRSSLLPVTFLSLLLVSLLFSGCTKDNDVQQAEDHLKRSEAYRAQGQFRAAIIEATNAINTDPEGVQYPVAMAEIYNELGAGRRASELLEDYAGEFPQEVALTLAEAYLLQGKFLSTEETLAGFSPRTTEEDRRKELYLADALRLRGSLEDSEAAYRALLQEYEGDLEIELRLAENHIYRNQWAQAREQLEPLRQQHPENWQVNKDSAVIALHDNQLERAERLLTQALIHAPQADIMRPERASILELLSETLTAMGRVSEALVYRKLLAEESPASVEAQQQLREATVAAESGDYARAERILQQLLEENPDSQAAALLLGMINLSQGNLDVAAPLLSRSVDVETADTEAIQAAAIAQAQTGNAGQALATLQRSLKARPDEPVLLSIYGLLALGQPELEREGYLSLQKALARDPHRGGLRLALARYHWQRNEPEQAMAQLRSGFQYQPADWVVTDVYINQLLARGELDEMAEALETLQQAAPRARETMLYQAQYQFRNGGRQEGIRTLRQLLREHSGYARGHAVLAQMHYENGDTDSALAAIDRVLALEPNNYQPLQAGITIITESSSDIDPQQWLGEMVERWPAVQANAKALSAMLYRDQGDLRRAASVLRTYEGETSDYLNQITSLVYRERSRQLAADGDYASARVLLLDALERFPTSKVLNLDLVRLDLAEQRLQQAEVLLQDLQARHPGDPEVILLSARLTQASDGDAAAYKALRSAWEEQPDSTLAIALLGLTRTEAPEAVEAFLREWEEAEPESRPRLLYLADQYQSAGNEQAAMEAYETLLVNNPDDPIALNNLAWMLKDRDLARAADLAERAVTLQPDSAAILDTYGWLLHLSGDRDRALAQLERAAELAPASSDIQKHLETVRAQN